MLRNRYYVINFDNNKFGFFLGYEEIAISNDIWKFLYFSLQNALLRNYYVIFVQ